MPITPLLAMQYLKGVTVSVMSRVGSSKMLSQDNVRHKPGEHAQADPGIFPYTSVLQNDIRNKLLNRAGTSLMRLAHRHRKAPES